MLVIKPSSLGDVVHTLPAVRFLKRAQPDLAIDWLANTEWMPLLEGNPDLRRVIEFPRSQFRGFAGMLAFLEWSRSLGDGDPELTLDFQGLARSALCAHASGAKRIHCLSNAELLPRLLSHRVVPTERHEHAVERYIRLVADLGVATDGLREFPLPTGTPPFGFDIQGRYLLLHPFSRGKGKSMPPACVERLCAELAPLPVVVAGRADAQLQLSANTRDFLNRTTLPELAWLIRNAAFTVSVDSGPMHIASALTDRLLAIHTWSDPRKVGPHNRTAWIWKAGEIVRAGEMREELATRDAEFSESDLEPLLRFLAREIAP